MSEAIIPIAEGGLLAQAEPLSLMSKVRAGLFVPLASFAFAGSPVFSLDSVHHTPKSEPVEVNITTLDGSSTVGEETPLGTIRIVENCGRSEKAVKYERPLQHLGNCATGSTLSVKEILPKNAPFSSPDYASTTIEGGDTQTIRVGGAAVDVEFINQKTALGNYGTYITNSYYYWVNGTYTMQANGLSADIAQEKPTLGSNGQHSLAELYVGSSTNAGEEAVEMGWTVDPSINGDDSPHLFIYHWVNGEGTCYNACGFVPVANSENIEPGTELEVGISASYKIAFSESTSQWVLYYNDEEIGYFPESIWNGSFTQSTFERAYGEVSSESGLAPCSEMGDGKTGREAGSASFRNIAVIGGLENMQYPAGNKLDVYSVPTNFLYKAGQISSTGFSYGGPGAGKDAGCTSKTAQPSLHGGG